VLSAGTGSFTLLLTVAVSVIVPGAVAVTVTVTVELDPLLMFPKLQLMPAPPPQLPWLAVAETNVVPAGTESVSTTPVAADGPTFVTVMV
jgi:hypothetical protein